MSMDRHSQRAKEFVLSIPILSDIVLHYWRFTHRLGACRGVYSTYDDACRAAKKIADSNYNADLIYGPETIGGFGPIRRRDYPVLFWLSHSVFPGMKILSLGGNAGTEYFTYRQFIEFPPDMRWTVLELPGVVAAAKTLTRDLTVPGLSFTTTLAEIDGPDILLTCGALPYLGEGLPTFIKQLPKRPQSIFIHRVPLYDGETFFTIQSVLQSVIPYRIESRKELVDSLGKIGYRVVDFWCEPYDVRIPFHKDRCVKYFWGFYLVSSEIPEPSWRAETIATAMKMRERTVWKTGTGVNFLNGW